ncbi:hypothetical protein AAG906_003162 [Vitis piasezkii]
MTAWKLPTHRWISEGKDGERTYRLPTHTLEGRCDDANMESSTIPLAQQDQEKPVTVASDAKGATKRRGKVKEKPIELEREEEEGGRRGSETLVISCQLGQQKLHAATLPCIILSLLNFIVPVLVALVGWRFQNDTVSVFQAHPTTIKVTVASQLAFVVTCGIELGSQTNHSPSWAALLRAIIMFSALLLVASLASLVRCLSVGHRIFMEKLHTLLTRMQQSQMRRNPPVLPLTNMDKSHTVPVTNMDAVYTVPTGTSL